MSWRLPVLAVVSVAGYYSILKTFQFAEASAAVPVIFSSTILTVLGGILVLKEEGNIPQKLFGAAFVIAGVLLLQS